MPFHPLTVTGPMINETSNTIFDLMLMHFVCKIRTRSPCYAFIQHDLHRFGYHLPDLISPCVGRQNLIIAVQFATIAADENDTIDLQRIALFDFVVMKLIRMRISATDTATASD